MNAISLTFLPIKHIKFFSGHDRKFQLQWIATAHEQLQESARIFLRN